MKTSFISLAATLLLAASVCSASAREVIYSAVNVNGNWYYCGQEMSWCKGGAFNQANLGIITSLQLGGQSQVSTGNDWGGGTMTMGYSFDGGSANYITLTYYGYTGTYNQLQSGGNIYSNTTIDFSSLSAGTHTIAVWFKSEDTYDSNNNANYVATFTKLEGEGTSDHPYLIKSISDLNALAASVNNGNDYEGVYFQLADYLDYTGQTYTPIGTVIPGTDTDEPIERPFKGIFDGNFKSIRGITIDAPEQDYIGVFGYVLGAGSVIQNLIVINSTFIGQQNVGGIVGYDFEGQIMGCFTSNVDVTGESHVGGIAGYANAYITQCRFLGAESENLDEKVGDIVGNIAGGITGFNEGSIEGCYCKASITGGENSLGVGGIAGTMTTASSFIADCIFEGTITGQTTGGILGARKKKEVETTPYMSRNYYNASDVKGVGDANGGYDITIDDGALPCLVSKTIPFNTGDQIYENGYYSKIGITVYEHCIRYDDNFYFSYVPLADQADNTNVLTACKNTGYNRFKLNGRTLYKTGDWNTLCLPFSVIDNDPADQITFTGTPLEGAIVKTLESSTLSSNGTLTMNFSENLTSIEAGKAYIVKWNKPTEGDDSGSNNIQDPIFSDVTVTLVEPNHSFQGTFDYLFLGCFNPYRLTPGDQTELYLGANNTLYFPAEGSNVTIGAFRGYFEKTIPADAPIRSIKINFGDESTGIKEITTDSDPSNPSNPSNSSNLSNLSNPYFSLDGLRLLSQPITPGLYIHNGRKVLIK